MVFFAQLVLLPSYLSQEIPEDSPFPKRLNTLERKTQGSMTSSIPWCLLCSPRMVVEDMALRWTQYHLFITFY